MRKAAVVADGRPMAFYPGSFDFGAMFYAPAGTRHWKSDVVPEQDPTTC